MSDCAPPTDAAMALGVRSRDSWAGDVIVTDFAARTRVETGTSPSTDGMLRLFAVRRGAWTLRYGRDAVALDAGRFLVRHSTGLVGFETVPYTSGVTVGVPAEAVATVTPMIGSVATPEMRLLLAYANLLQDTIGDLTATGVDAARNALVELARGVVHSYVDGVEPALAPALVLAARELADRLLADPELTPRLIARELNVSVRTLNRAFAVTDEPVGAYIRRRRLEEARRELATGYTVSQVAARWQFADGSHFTRAFRQRYGQTPSDYRAAIVTAGVPPRPAHRPA